MEPAEEPGTLWRFLWWHYHNSSHSPECSVCFVCRSPQCVHFPLKLHLLNQWWHFPTFSFCSTKETRKSLAPTIWAWRGTKGKKIGEQWTKEKKKARERGRERERTGQKGISISFLILWKQRRPQAQVINQSYGSCNNEGSGLHKHSDPHTHEQMQTRINDPKQHACLSCLLGQDLCKASAGAFQALKPNGVWLCTQIQVTIHATRTREKSPLPCCRRVLSGGWQNP